VVELIEHDALHLHVGDLILLGDEFLVHDLESVDITGVLLLGPYHLPFQCHAAEHEHSTRTAIPTTTYTRNGSTGGEVNNLGVRADAVDLAQLEVLDGELLLRRAECDPADCGGGGSGRG
jgi:hypothetical protein